MFLTGTLLVLLLTYVCLVKSARAYLLPQAVPLFITLQRPHIDQYLSTKTARRDRPTGGAIMIITIVVIIIIIIVIVIVYDCLLLTPFVRNQTKKPEIQGFDSKRCLVMIC